MPVFAADLLPDATGRNLGNLTQKWNAWLQSLNVAGPAVFQPVAGQSVTMGGVVYVSTAAITANANTTGRQNLSSAPIPAGLLNVVGKVMRVTVGGLYTTQAGQTPAFSLAVWLGTPIIFGVSTPALPAATSNAPWWIQFLATVITSGSSGAVDCFGAQLYETAASPSGVATSMINTLSSAGPIALGPIDLTVAQTLQTGVFFTTNTSPANVCVQRQFVVEVLN